MCGYGEERTLGKEDKEKFDPPFLIGHSFQTTSVWLISKSCSISHSKTHRNQSCLTPSTAEESHKFPSDRGRQNSICFSFQKNTKNERVTYSAVWVPEVAPLEGLLKVWQSKPNQESAPLRLGKSSGDKETGNFDLCLFV